ncbi:LysR family transcriptional regulator [Plantactinospora sp. S1510]|uniref:LysR family transcriptional regulator n=1 Tax=Plantactinospora alkalitolerans TaxID=2789879 RepID=A0ABS0H7Z7_9ACTN|nr:LysR family transcriptional regulator [Plantactinospora alkalitolerans]MBF9134587.1 LysR family transcriptional regulator [Plantactinospora alkalitolerans]
MDLDLRQLRAFVATAEELHFRRAADRLFLTQQALSHRVHRLEETLGGPLFIRGHHVVELTELGRRLLPLSRRVLDAADEVVAAAHLDRQPLRLDTFRPIAASSMLHRLVPELGDLPLELSTRHSLGTALSAMRRGEIDVALGRVHGPTEPCADELAHRLVRLEPLNALMSDRHPLATRSALRPADLAPYGIWSPAVAGATELDSYLRTLGDDLGIPVTVGPAFVTFEQVVAEIQTHGQWIWLLGADVRATPPPGMALIPLVDPTPLYPWSLVWRRDRVHPLLGRLLRTAAATAGRAGWLSIDPTRHWLPAPDRAAVLSSADLAGGAGPG